LGWLVWEVDWQPVAAALGATHVGWFCAALALYGVAQAISALRWQLLAQPLGFRASYGRHVSLYCVGMFFNLFLPTSLGGDVVKAWRLAEHAHGLPRRRWRAVLSVFSERFCGLLALLLLATAATAAAIDLLPLWILAMVWGLAAGCVVGLALLPLAASRLAKAGKLVHALSLSRRHGRRWAAAFGLSLAVQVAAVLQVWFLALALALPASVWVCAVVAPLVSLLTLLPVSVNGIGVREASLVLLLAPAGVAAADALGLGLLWFVMLLAASAPGGVLCCRPESSDLVEKANHGRIGGDPGQGRAGQSAAAA
jgi:hypothetical protein